MLIRITIQNLGGILANSQEKLCKAGLTIPPNPERRRAQLAETVYGTTRKCSTHPQVEPLPIRTTLMLVLLRWAVCQIQIDGVGPLRLGGILQHRTGILGLEPLVTKPQGLSFAAALHKRLSHLDHSFLKVGAGGEDLDRQIGWLARPGMIARDANHTTVLFMAGNGQSIGRTKRAPQDRSGMLPIKGLGLRSLMTRSPRVSWWYTVLVYAPPWISANSARLLIFNM